MYQIKDAAEHIFAEGTELDELRVVFESHYVRMLRVVHLLVAGAFDVPDFRLDDASARQFILEAGARAVGVNETTKEAIRQQLAAGQEIGESNIQLAARIEHLFEVTWKGRPELVARTELQNAQLHASVNRYQATGLVHTVIAHDGGQRDSDAYCNARDGRRYPVGSPPQLAHPNCTLTVSPIVDTEVIGG